MLKEIQLCLCAIFIFAFGIFYQLYQDPGCVFSCKPISKHSLTPKDVMSQGRSIIFLETTENLQPSPLVLCSVESAARIYLDRPIIFLMKGMDNNSMTDLASSCPSLSFLYAMKNVFIFPLKLNILFQDTPLLPWYLQVNATQEKHWVYIISDAIRLAMVWRYGGIYMDTDVISIRPIPVTNFLAAQSSQFSSNGIFGFQQYHQFLWDCMEDFVENYNGDIWGNQGPYLITRMLSKLCNLTDFVDTEDQKCHNISFLNPQRFYPIPYGLWTKYYEVWDSRPEFNNSYALHLWNYMNQDQKKNITVGSNTLVENLFRTYCPTTYKTLIRAAKQSEHLFQNETR
ncbi:alpha-1,4-N-acetylglucosaminyltransferase [Anolis carolinensis]|uniref:Alpha-1,4-N-acetylglucosaminyltransferase n=1 Tax=Anolis carolinensis TaxID=28377 RepID=G1KIM2_ANOCA|nr:PREDICTED: alpha-1,4-N-acetylglucosaminyltransferase [Anolis carolinensis]|eukprot:XP_003218461.1 PREDICTED: alpha-1,4-N-acetylglucosaminyltransferase [Anolis carolinensis]